MPSFLKGLNLFCVTVLPALFPFMFLTKTLTDLGIVNKLSLKLDKFCYIIFRMSGIGAYLFIMSLLCGYPVGTKILSDLKKDGQITEKEAENILPLCSTSGPLFVIGSVGVGMFGSKSIGITIFAAHIISTIIFAIIYNQTKFFYNKLKKKSYITTNQIQYKNISNDYDKILSKNMMDSCQSILLVGGFVSFFFLIIDIIFELKLFYPLQVVLNYAFNKEIALGITSGIIEMTRGCFELSKANSNNAIIATSTLVSFSGLSIILQSISFLSQANISSKKFIKIKILQTLVTFIVSLILIKFLL